MHSDLLAQILADLNGTHATIEASTLISMTGLALASSLPPDVDEDRVSAISAAVLSLGKSTLRTLRYGDVEQVLITAKYGTVLITPAGEQAFIAVLVKPDARLDLITAAIQQTVVQIKEYR
ncbi:MAG: hypothetical protein RL122_1257 [Pseudomonadota bacterium]|jgi:predicted regulator of Ras-like GTPase activity (Roadblock/LC7/MglB family)|uniref:Roadblock/LC7 domain-containing protein n=1 Tax=Thiothrix fructosivorans TaxID=111770 RepID=A0A8B0SE88_9GAMM|nr:roadblock/LC7 domain-containing protein [Thiothrix fructosivorans]MBO0613992.1 roadblock/LC7 domain-containing protein [Thiothrix fructosivorans]QTX10353.1 roadblock/LC7 domain-containing protein [Thiothrix fructosivorans]